MFISAAGFTVLAATTFVLFLLNFAESLKHALPLLFLAVNLAALGGLSYETWLELRRCLKRSIRFAFSLKDLYNYLSVMLGTIATYLLNVELGLGPVAAAGLIGITASVLLPEQDVPVYCGAFVGMSCPVAFRGYECLVPAGMIAGTLFVASKDVFNGFGGKLGTIAFFGAVSAIFIKDGGGVPGAPPAWLIGRYIILYSVLAATITFLISTGLKKGPVFSSGLVGLAGGMLLPNIYPVFGELLGVIVICASFAGMSSRERIFSNLQMCAAGAFSGIFFIYTLAHFPGAGGKLGTIAFMSVIAVRGCVDIWARLKEMVSRRKTGRISREDNST